MADHGFPEFSREFRRELGELMARVEETADAMDRRDAKGWLVVCLDLEEPVSVVACYGPFPEPEQALIEAARQAETSLDRTYLAEPGEPGWSHVVVPLFEPVFVKEAPQ